jgi:hypothetical protein
VLTQRIDSPVQRSAAQKAAASFLAEITLAAAEFLLRLHKRAGAKKHSSSLWRAERARNPLAGPDSGERAQP